MFLTTPGRYANHLFDPPSFGAVKDDFGTGGRCMRRDMTDDERQIRDLVDSWMAASKARDIEGVLALMTDDVIFMTPGRPPFGKLEFAADSERMSDVEVDGRSDVEEIGIFGDTAFIRNHIQISLTKAGDGPKRKSGYAMSILRKQPDGRWRLARDANLVVPEEI
jgi:uncharacterized protein (TIGR02246 family)